MEKVGGEFELKRLQWMVAFVVLKVINFWKESKVVIYFVAELKNVAKWICYYCHV